MSNQPYILSIAGHDPSGGAGLTQDIKTFEAHQLYGLSVCTAITVQNDMELKDCKWVDENLIIAQIETLFDRIKTCTSGRRVSVVKIGIVASWDVLLTILKTIKKLNAEILIVLDPILKATSGYDFHNKEAQDVLDEIWKYCAIITPNYDEIKLLYPDKSVDETIAHISGLTNVYLKGGHRDTLKGVDELYYSKIVKVAIQPSVDKIFEKHGSGCVFSSALASNLALEIALEDACRNAKKYTEQFLNSNSSLLGTHSKITAL